MERKQGISLLLAVLSLPLLGSCGGSGDGTPPPTEPYVTNTTPKDNTTDVARNSAVSATFNTNMFAETVNANSFTLSGTGNGDGSVSGMISFDSDTNVATLAPVSDLALLTNYEATITTDITDLSGNALVSEYTWSFTTADGAWGTAELIESDDAGDADNAQIIFDANGNAFAVWHQYDGARYNIWANRYIAGTGWGIAELIETNDIDSATFPQIAADASGNAIAVWKQSDGIRENIWANRYAAGTGWGVAELIENNDVGLAQRVYIAIDPGGNALAVWEQDGGPMRDIWANRYTAESGWGEPELLETDNTNHAQNSRIAMDINGNALAIWEQFDGVTIGIWAIRYTASVGWGTPELIETNENSANSSDLSIVFDSSGNATAVWKQFDGTADSIYTNRYTTGSGWGTAVLIETDDTGDADWPQIAVEAGGDVVVVWTLQDGDTFSNIMSTRFTVGSGWGPAELIETDDLNEAYDAQVTLDPSGNAMAVWSQWNGAKDDLWVNRYTAGVGWGTAELAEFIETGDAYVNSLNTDATGNILALINKFDGERWNIWANRFE